MPTADRNEGKAMSTVLRLVVAGSSLQVLVRCSVEHEMAPALGPTIGEYPCYDASAYSSMTTDEERNTRFRAALDRLASGKVVLDIGTGADLLWARESLKYGARHAFAMESMGEPFQQALNTLEFFGLGEDITLLHGTSTALEIDSKADLCVAEIIGSLASAEGAAAVLTDAKRRHLTSNGIVIPHRCVTLAAPVSLRGVLGGGPIAFSTESIGYLTAIFAWNQAPFDVRLRIEHPTPSAILSAGQVVETLDFNGDLMLQQRTTVQLTIDRPGLVDGVLTWLNIWCLPDGSPLDALTVESNWASIYFPLFGSEIPVEAGDTLDLTFASTISDDGVHPDYHLKGVLHTARTGEHAATYTSMHHSEAFRGHPIYKQLFPE
jgi:protein arginine N-methyltransferase 1